jgi:hypothetical protein
MFVRISSVKRSGTCYEYAQLVESYRRSDGKPGHRILFNLGRITDRRLVDNLTAAFQAARQQQSVVATDPAASAVPRRPTANLRYLDVAVVLELLRDWDIPALLERSLPADEAEVAASKVVLALVAQRCLEPDSKLHATRWFPRTALPELLGIDPQQFNNTRVHRVLDALDSASRDLMRGLSERCAERAGRFACLFLDITDTWFVGHGPSLAVVGKTKEGLFQRKIGIVLLCDPEGYPLRWEVIAGNTAEQPAMLEMIRAAGDLPWLRDAPIVCDRAMGRSSYIAELAATGLQFITALAAPEFEAYAESMAPVAASLESLSTESDEQLAACAEEARKRATAAGMTFVDATLLVMDLGRIRCPWLASEQPFRDDDRAREALRLAQSIDESVRSGEFSTFAAAALARGHTRDQAKWYRPLLRLSASVQQRILAGEACGRSISELRRISALPTLEARDEAFEQLLTQPALRPDLPTPVLSQKSAPGAVEQLRCAVYFNPEAFAAQRLLVHRTVESIHRYLEDLNRQLAHPRSRITRTGIQRRLEEKLGKHELLSAFRIEIDERTIAGQSRLQARLVRDEADWRRRRRSDGFTVIVAHPEVSLDAERLSRTYRAKDAVENDFHIIKSLVELRPVRHRTDGKVRAHVSLCMLALLAQRTLHAKLAKTRARPELAFEALEPCRLNYYAGRRPLYTLTRPDDEQRSLLRKLGLLRLIDDREVAATVMPRSAFVPTDEAEDA